MNDIINVFFKIKVNQIHGHLRGVYHFITGEKNRSFPEAAFALFQEREHSSKGMDGCLMEP